MKKEQRVRLKFIDAMFEEYGRLGRPFLVQVFGISEITASRDFSIYMEMQPGVAYNRSTKTFESLPGFHVIPSLWKTDPKDFLNAIKKVYEVDFGNIQITAFTVKDTK